MKKHQIVILLSALIIFALTWLGVYFINRNNKEIISPDVIQEFPEYKTVLIFFPNKIKNPESTNCEVNYPVERAVKRESNNPRSALGEYAYLALAELIKGPAGYEKDNGYFTLINEGTKIKSISIEGGVAHVDFNDKLDEGIAGSCKVQAIRSQITETLKQFPGVDSVIISVAGDSEDVLQP